MPRCFSIEIESPCPVGWNTMSGNDSVRFCDHCQKNVFNLSNMTEQEVADVFEVNGTRICVNIQKRPDGTDFASKKNTCKTAGLRHFRTELMWCLKAITIIAIFAQCTRQSMAQGILSAWPDDYFGTSEELSQRDLKEAEEYRRRCWSAERSLQSSPPLNTHAEFVEYFRNLNNLTGSLIASNVFVEHKRKNIDALAYEYCRYTLLAVDRVTYLSESEAREILCDIAYRLAYLRQNSLSKQLYARAEAIPIRSRKPWIGKSADQTFRPRYFLTHPDSPLTP